MDSPRILHPFLRMLRCLIGTEKANIEERIYSDELKRATQEYKGASKDAQKAIDGLLHRMAVDASAKIIPHPNIPLTKRRGDQK